MRFWCGFVFYCFSGNGKLALFSDLCCSCWKASNAAYLKRKCPFLYLLKLLCSPSELLSVSRRFFTNMYLISFYVAGYSSWVYVCALHTQNAHWCQKKALNPLHLELMQFWGSVWALGTEPRSWAREDSALTMNRHFSLIPRWVWTPTWNLLWFLECDEQCLSFFLKIFEPSLLLTLYVFYSLSPLPLIFLLPTC